MVIILLLASILFSDILSLNTKPREHQNATTANSTAPKLKKGEINNVFTHRDNRNKPEFLIPNIVHFIWYSFKENKIKSLCFREYLSVLSADRMMHADKIYFHTNNEPIGQYWEELKKLPTLVVKNREPPTELFGVKLKDPAWPTSTSNVDKVKLMQEYGGVVADLDVFFVNRLDPIRVYPAVLGYEMEQSVCGGFMMSEPNSTFMYLWLNSMLNDYNVEKWAYISGILPSRLEQRYNSSGLVHIEPTKIHRPNFDELHKLIGPQPYNWKDNYVVHTFYRLWKFYKRKVESITPQSIKTMNTTFGQIARKIYYGSSELIAP